MKRVLYVFAITLILSATQIQTPAQANDSAPAAASDSTSSNSGQAASTPDNSRAKKSHAPKRSGHNQGQPAAEPVADHSTATPSSSGANTANANTANATPATPSASESPRPASSPSSSTANSTPAPAISAPSSAVALTNVYRVGAGDVLDIRLLNSNSRESTLFTVLPGGLLEYTLAGDAIPVAGLTTDEIAARLKSKIKIIDNPQVVVSVREYVSHSVIVTGLVSDPGARLLRREAVPLYVVLAEAQPRTDAGQATIMRNGESIKVDLADTNAASTLVLPGDVINVAVAPPAPPQYFYIGGDVGSPGQKNFHPGITLTQAILASGGVVHSNSYKVRVSRQGTNGLLISTDYDLRKIENGLAPDPQLQPGDRIEVNR